MSYLLLPMMTELVTQACLPEDDAHKLPKGLPTTEAILRSLFTLRATPFLLSKAELQAAYDAERVEYEDSVLVLQQKVREVAEILKRGSHNVCFTGAGISTSGGIPDFRGPQGMWTLKDKGEHVKGKNVSRARPTLAHYAVTELARRNLLHFIITTNMDGKCNESPFYLHRKVCIFAVVFLPI
ncbi:NAD-dependent protein deacetylase Sirt7 [Pelomyxa schiedti]|nr:NAD-dependent protein deacetylase Sirt7 [Pelomyxa schiedti]